MADVELDPKAFATALSAMGRLVPDRPLPLEDLTLTLVPREAGLQDKQIPVDALGTKLVSMRNKLRVLEQRINASDLSLDEKVLLQGHVTRTYDAFTGLMAFFSEDALPLPDVGPTEEGAKLDDEGTA